ncbi:hypothetical protein MASR2M17_06960 [Aminivibrio sp.]
MPPPPSRGPTNRTGFAACRLGILAFIVPFAFCYDPGLLLKSSLLGNLTSIISGGTALTALGFAMAGYAKGRLSSFYRLAFGMLGLLALYNNRTVSLAAAAATLGAFLFRGEIKGRPEGEPERSDERKSLRNFQLSAKTFTGKNFSSLCRNMQKRGALQAAYALALFKMN